MDWDCYFIDTTPIVPARLVEPENKKTFTLEELQEYVQGSIEFLRINSVVTMVINEDGATPDSDLLINPLASSIAGQTIYGGVVLVDRQSLE